MKDLEDAQEARIIDKSPTESEEEEEEEDPEIKGDDLIVSQVYFLFLSKISIFYEHLFSFSIIHKADSEIGLKVEARSIVLILKMRS